MPRAPEVGTMPFVTCPRCRNEFAAPRDMLGLLVPCPHCRGDVAVEDEPSGGGAGGGVSDYARPRRRKSSGPPLGLLVGGGVVAAVLVVGLAAMALSSRSGGPSRTGGPNPVAALTGSSTSTADRWTFKELHQHLVDSGCTWTYRPGRGDTGYLMDPHPRPGDSIDREERGLIVAVDGAFQGTSWPDDVLLVTQTRDAEAARQAAGKMTRGTFSYGRWLFVGDERMLARARAALGG